MLWSLLRRLPRSVKLALCIGLALFTTHKLYTMFRIRGFLGGSKIASHDVTTKWRERGARSRVFCYVSWAEDAHGDNRGDKRHRAQCDCEWWETVEPGDRVSVVRLDGDDDAHVQGEGALYDSTGNFVFDFVLLGFELFGIFYFLRHRDEPANS